MDENINILEQIDLLAMSSDCEELKASIRERERIKIDMMCFGYTRDCERQFDYIFPDYLKRIVWNYAKELPWDLDATHC